MPLAARLALNAARLHSAATQCVAVIRLRQLGSGWLRSTLLCWAVRLHSCTRHLQSILYNKPEHLVSDDREMHGMLDMLKTPLAYVVAWSIMLC